MRKLLIRSINTRLVSTGYIIQRKVNMLILAKRRRAGLVLGYVSHAARDFA